MLKSFNWADCEDSDSQPWDSAALAAAKEAHAAASAQQTTFSPGPARMTVGSKAPVPVFSSPSEPVGKAAQKGSGSSWSSLLKSQTVTPPTTLPVGTLLGANTTTSSSTSKGGALSFDDVEIPKARSAPIAAGNSKKSLPFSPIAAGPSTLSSSSFSALPRSYDPDLDSSKDGIPLMMKQFKMASESQAQNLPSLCETKADDMTDCHDSPKTDFTEANEITVQVGVKRKAESPVPCSPCHGTSSSSSSSTPSSSSNVANTSSPSMPQLQSQLSWGRSTSLAQLMKGESSPSLTTSHSVPSLTDRNTNKQNNNTNNNINTTTTSTTTERYEPRVKRHRDNDNKPSSTPKGASRSKGKNASATPNAHNNTNANTTTATQSSPSTTTTSPSATFSSSSSSSSSSPVLGATNAPSTKPFSWASRKASVDQTKTITPAPSSPPLSAITSPTSSSSSSSSSSPSSSPFAVPVVPLPDPTAFDSMSSMSSFSLTRETSIATTTDGFIDDDEDSSLTAEEKKANRLRSRLKQIAMGYATPEYQEYIKRLPKRKRVKYVHPRTPDATREDLSNRQFAGYVKSWRRKLYLLEFPADGSVVVKEAPSKQQDKDQQGTQDDTQTQTQTQTQGTSTTTTTTTQNDTEESVMGEQENAQ